MLIHTQGKPMAMNAKKARRLIKEHHLVNKEQKQNRKKSAADIIEGYIRKINQLENFAKRFDEGEDNYDVIAGILRVLVIDKPGGQSRSMLETLGVANKIRILSTCAPFSPMNLLPTTGIVVQRISENEIAYIAPLDDSPHGGRLMKVDQWMKEIIFIAHKFTFTRSQVISAIADKEGGAHFDRDFEEGHYRLSRENALGWSIQYPDGTTRSFGDPFPAAIRQIAFEVLKMNELLKAEGWLSEFENK
jgi:hypothetical protein